MAPPAPLAGRRLAIFRCWPRRFQHALGLLRVDEAHLTSGGDIGSMEAPRSANLSGKKTRANEMGRCNRKLQAALLRQ